jgi:hypothetical protein
MHKKQCRLTVADKYFGGGGGGGSINIPQRDPKKEQKTIRNYYGFQENQLRNFIAQSPLLSTAQQNALDYQGTLPGMINQLGQFSNQIGTQGAQLGGYQGQLGNIYSTQLAPTILSGGALTPQLARDVAQQTRGIAAAQGTAQSPGALGTELLNREQYRQQRFNQALTQGQSVLGQQAGLAGQQAGLTGLRAGLVGQQQELQTGGLGQLNTTATTGSNVFANTTNPMLQYLSNLFGGNQQAAVQGAQIAAQQQAASQAGKGSTIGGAIGAVGSLAGAAL